MIRVDAHRPVHFCDGLSRRDFLHAGALSALGLGLPQWQALAASGSTPRDRDINCIMLFLVGGPSQLDTWDMKPEAPEEIRGPFRPIATKIPGVQISEVFPRLAALTDKVSFGALGKSHGGRGARYRAPDDADRAAVRRGHRLSALRMRAFEDQRLAE